MEHRLSYVLQPRPRVVSYGIGFDDLPCLPENESFDPGRYGAETVALPARLLPAVWKTSWTPDFPVVIFTGPGFGNLTQSGRELIWRRWGVPAYEQRLSVSGDLLAEECDAHDWLHLNPEADFEGYCENRRCSCGYSGPVLAAGGQESVLGNAA